MYVRARRRGAAHARRELLYVLRVLVAQLAHLQLAHRAPALRRAEFALRLRHLRFIGSPEGCNDGSDTRMRAGKLCHSVSWGHSVGAHLRFELLHLALAFAQKRLHALALLHQRPLPARDGSGCHCY